MNRTLKLLIALVAALCLLAGSVAMAETKVELNVFAAASLTESLTKISELYSAVQPDVTLSFNFDSSGTLQTQIESGAAADLFISAAKKQMDALEEGGYLLEGTRKNLLNNKVVLIVPEGSTLGLKSFEDVAGDAVKLVALGNSDVPVGQYAQEVFTTLGSWDAISAKASLGANVKEVLSQVASGSVDCGVVYATDAATAKGVTVVAEAPEGSHKPVVYPGAALKDSANADAAKAFLDYLTTPDAVAAFEAVGFAMAPAPEAASAS
jgi:molybdate transport system substrate-binding protein